jgi:hypothetical protein
MYCINPAVNSARFEEYVKAHAAIKGRVIHNLSKDKDCSGKQTLYDGHETALSRRFGITCQGWGDWLWIDGYVYWNLDGS